MRAHEPSEVFKALGVPSRMHILMLLKARGPLPVKEIAEALHMTSPAVSQHLKILKHVGLVDARREGYWVPYAVNAEALHDCCGQLVRVCACPHCQDDGCGGEVHSEAEALRHRRNELLAELQHIEEALDAL